MSSPIHLFKAIKNKTEISGFKAANIRDGLSMVKFLHWLNKAVGKAEVSEISAQENLRNPGSASGSIRSRMAGNGNEGNIGKKSLKLSQLSI